MTLRWSLRHHWPEYLMEAWGLCTFMLVAGMVVTLLHAPGSPAVGLIADPLVRQALTGLGIGLTAMAIIYSPWGQRSGAHLNPSVTLTYWRLGKVARWDALFFVLAQFAGGALGVAADAWLLGSAFAAPPVAYLATLPGAHGVAAAFAAEFTISMVLMLVVLFVSNTARLARLTGLCAGLLITVYVTFEAPLSGMSMNPARTFAAAAAGRVWMHLWLYFTAPVLGMLTAAALYCRLPSGGGVRCAKLDHPADVKCIHCGRQPLDRPARASRVRRIRVLP
jgi:aquaporin Z